MDKDLEITKLEMKIQELSLEINLKEKYYFYSTLTLSKVVDY